MGTGAADERESHLASPGAIVDAFASPAALGVEGVSLASRAEALLHALPRASGNHCLLHVPAEKQCRATAGIARRSVGKVVEDIRRRHLFSTSILYVTVNEDPLSALKAACSPE